MKSRNQNFICRLFGGKCDDAEELLRAQRLFNNKTFEKHVYNYLEKEWEAFIEEDTEYVDPEGWDDLYKRTVRKAGIHQVWRMRYVAVAASVAAIMLLALGGILVYPGFLNDKGAQVAQQPVAGPDKLPMLEARTRNGQTMKVMLSDGTEVELNAGTAIRYPAQITEKQRTVYVDGEAFFSRNDTLSPLFIKTTHMSAAVVGESFVVSAYREDPEINIILDGPGHIQSAVPLVRMMSKPMMRKPGDSAAQPRPVFEAAVPRPVQPRDARSARIRKSAAMVEFDLHNDQQEFFAWKDNKIYLKDANLEKIQHTLERVYDLKLEVKGCVASENKFSGEFSHDAVEQLLASIAHDWNARYDRDDPNKVVLVGDCANDPLRQ